jgi:hypothetical protein
VPKLSKSGILIFEMAENVLMEQEDEMAKVETYKCDASGCKEQRKESNHWWCVFRTGRTLTIAPFNGDIEDQEVPHACGIECALKLAAQKMGEMTA